jgi:hypothetical protein
MYRIVASCTSVARMHMAHLPRQHLLHAHTHTARHINDNSKKRRCEATVDPDVCLQQNKLKVGAAASTQRTGGLAQAAVQQLLCKDLLWTDQHRYPGAGDKKYLSNCWPTLTWEDFLQYDLMDPSTAITPGNNNGAADVIKLLLAASTLNRIPTCSTLFIPLNKSELAAALSRINSHLFFPSEKATAARLPQPPAQVSMILLIGALRIILSAVR